jgi:sarcosine oxidase, subunit gamma
LLRVGAGGRAAVAAALGLTLPERIGARQVQGSRIALCLGPDEWVVHAPEDEAPAILEACATAAAAAPLCLVDIGDREVALAVEGPGVRDLLAGFCPRDLDALPVGAGVRTLLDSVQVVLLREGEDQFRLEVWRSFAPHLRALLDLGLREIEAGL